MIPLHPFLKHPKGIALEKDKKVENKFCSLLPTPYLCTPFLNVKNLKRTLKHIVNN